MKSWSSDAQDALDDGDVMTGGAVEILCDPVMRIFSGYGTMAIDGDDYTGVGNQQLVSQVGAAIGGTAQGMTLELSGVDSDIVPLINYTSAKRALTTVRRLMLNSAGTVLLAAPIFARGRLDTLDVEETPGATATIRVTVEGAGRALGRRGGRMRTDSDQRLISADDACFKAVSYAGEKMLYWGGHRPAGTGGGPFGLFGLFR